jgi:hypothetical protein
MRCRVCRANMNLVQTVPAKTIRAPGYEHRSFRCLTCSAVERRLAFIPQDLPQSAEPPSKRAVRVKSAATPSHKVAALAAVARAMGKLRGR